jgi:hypothetical protein
MNVLRLTFVLVHGGLLVIVDVDCVVHYSVLLQSFQTCCCCLQLSTSALYRQNFVPNPKTLKISNETILVEMKG